MLCQSKVKMAKKWLHLNCCLRVRIQNVLDLEVTMRPLSETRARCLFSRLENIRSSEFQLLFWLDLTKLCKVMMKIAW